MRSLLIVGGGITGIFSALKLYKQFKNVFIVERAPWIGGLLASRRISEVYYDYGTHVLSNTTSDEVNSILFDEENLGGELSWRKLPYLKVANYFMGSWNRESSFLDVRNLPKKIYDLGIREFLAGGSPDYSKRNLNIFLQEAFGPTIAEHVYRPVIGKILGESLDNVLPEVLLQYSLHRIIAFDAEKSRELKKNPTVDTKLGFHSYKDYPPTKPYLYPVGNEGMGAWVKSLENQLKLKGVKIIKNSSVTDIERTTQGFKVCLSASELPMVTDIIWTIPAASAARALKIKFNYESPRFRFATIVNLGFDKPFLRDNHYLLIWDVSMVSFRITLYPNLKAVGLGVFNCSVEILTDSEITDKASLLRTVLKEVITLGLVSARANLVESEIIDIGPAFPVKTPEFYALVNQVTALFENLYPDILFLGKALGQRFLLNDTIVHANEVLDRHFRAQNGH